MVVHPPLYILTSSAQCWRCEKPQPVTAVGCRSLTDDGQRIGEPGRESELILLWKIAQMPQTLEKLLTARNPRYAKHHSITADETYYANICECGANFGDYFLFAEPGGAFFPKTAEAARGIVIETLPIDRRLELDCFYSTGIGDFIWGHAKKADGATRLLIRAAELACKACGHHFHIDAEDLDIEEIGADERQMGPEIFHSGTADIVCPQCRNPIQVTLDTSEYPIGVSGFEETTATGADIVHGFADVALRFDQQIYEFDRSSGLYVPEEKRIITDLCDSASALLQELHRNPDTIFAISPREFEEIIAHIFSMHGFTVDLTKRTRDGGKDIIAFNTDRMGVTSKYLIECKRYAPSRPVGVAVVRALYGVQRNEGANKAIVATTSRFTSAAKAFATKKDSTQWAMDLKDIRDIREWLAAAANPLRLPKG
jgi:restriction system protein